MRLCFLADARSPIARNWIQECAGLGHDTHVISSYPCDADAIPGATIHVIPFAFTSLSKIRHNGAIGHTRSSSSAPSPLSRLLAELRSGKLVKVAEKARNWLAPLDLYPKIDKVASTIRGIKPDLVHAMRLPFEGFMAALTDPPVPLLISIWGNDLTLHAENNAVLGRLTKRALHRTNALHCDCARDLVLAERWGFDQSKPSKVLPGGGGIQLDVFERGPKDQALLRELNIPASAPVVLNPRGFRPYVRNDVFFQSIPLVLARRPDAMFLGLGMAGNPVAESWIVKLGISHCVRLLGSFDREQMASLYRLADVTVSPSNHDGTPNTLIEAMSCGCFPVAGDIESIREWVQSGVNGVLCDQNDSHSLADGIVEALNNSALRESARAINQEMIAKRAEFHAVMSDAIRFYESIVKTHRAEGSRSAGKAVQSTKPRSEPSKYPL